MKTCSVCNCSLTGRMAEPFRVNGVSGYLCAQHAASLGNAIGAWLARTLHQIERDRAEAESEARIRLEREASSMVAAEIAADRMALLAAEGLPIATRREMRTRGRAAC